MGDNADTSSIVAATTDGATPATVGTQKKAAVKSKKLREKPAHPKTAEMINSAIKELKERGGSSLQAIKKYMVSTYKIDAEKQATFIKKYLRAAVASGALVQTKGKGAAGSFKLAAKVETTKPKAKPAAKAKSPKKVPAVKKPVAVKKPSAVVKKVPMAATAPVSQKKVSKGPAAKPPKAKTIKAKPATKSPIKKAKPAATKKVKPVAATPKKVVPKNAAAGKK